MSWSDPIADLLTRIRNAGMAKHKRLDVPASNFKEAILKLMVRENYIKSYRKIEEGPQGVLRIYLRYEEDERNAIEGLERVSKPGRRVYVDAASAPRVRSGLGVSVISTSHGVMTDLEARQKCIGGEVIAKIW
ncbi:MAG: 30S ribosomal protein S8 [Candidatus Eisenbacteria bacterium]|uniref:Small ribosomal subunit protein uS8 n=1 Tax=Eiseniibacteriota bacterium TaxID=2212470 RepID=A0A948WCQ5_UNCEI|nr:30S ribosomal protein S8 [Candidatus Eisenbacteria bacterium]MBU1951244.1 30S ribosomal protein S8 [Candidatus Eisenbacteria bacterium]MBU2691133.1 30S ribosomal protein S8 [Candidatus Eisenbacteria bacterium]